MRMSDPAIPEAPQPACMHVLHDLHSSCKAHITYRALPNKIRGFS